MQAKDTADNDNKINDEPDYKSDDNDISKLYSFHTLAKLLEPVPKLTSQNYYSWSAHVIFFLRSVPHAMEHLKRVYNPDHPKWSCPFDDTLTNAV
ncbi:uncharacterized protein UBRO_21044 [Ustilago bromivora]|uniref:Uncharacterized protein n=1 Tax=Ustilago bromivora TaxID=307758 RepID=A0A1K0GJ64_9BASI|nr:uncharacterized protein UBRO_21044 [Ustilago bromivora]